MADRPGRDVVKVDQVFHGYRDGHRLLASSIELDSADRRCLARQTDAPDTGSTQGWESLLAGYPLPSGLFAISMTWPAIHMARPGCVWTQTLLLDSVAVAAATPGAVLALLHRPDCSAPNAATYERAVSFGQGSTPTPDANPRLQSWLGAVSWAFYDAPARHVRVTGVDLSDEARHLLLLQVWAQAWPSLRSTLTFADAPETPRVMHDRPFDLQLHWLGRSHDDGARVLTGIPETTPPAWVTSSIDELDNPSGLSEFLAMYGPCPGEDRSSMRGLVTIFAEHSHTETEFDAGRRVLAEIVGMHPESSSGRTLKRDVLAPRSAPVGCARRLSETGLLRALVNTPNDAALDRCDMAVGARTRALLASGPEDALGIVASIGDVHQALAAEYIAAVVGGCADRAAPQCGKQGKAVLLALVEQFPELLHRSEMWRCIDADRLWGIAVGQRGKTRRMLTLRAIMSTNASLEPQRVVGDWKNSGPLILQALADVRSNGDQLRRWLKVVPPGLVLSFVSERSDELPELLSVALESVPVSVIATLPPDVLRRVVCAPAVSTETITAVWAASLRRTWDPEWADLALGVYGWIVDRGRRGRLGAATRRLDSSESVLPAKAMCARVASAMNKALKGSAWPILSVLSLEDRAAFRALVDADRRAGLARSVLVEAARTGTALRPWQLSIINGAIDARADRASLMETLEKVSRALWSRGRSG